MVQNFDSTILVWCIRGQAIIQTNAGLLYIGPLETNFSKILIKLQNSSFTKMYLKV